MPDLARAPVRSDALSHALDDTMRTLEKDGSPYAKNLTAIWRDCVRVHDDNEMVRTNLMQMEAVLQQQLQNWVGTSEQVDRLCRTLSGMTVQDEEFERILRLAQEVNGEMVKALGGVNACIRDLKKEIRMTEFQQRYWIHVNAVQTFIAGITAILVTQLQTEDKRGLVIDQIRRLAKTYLVASTRPMPETTD